MPPATFDPLNLLSGVLADVAQPVEQRFRKPPVGSSSLPVGSENRGLSYRCDPPNLRLGPQSHTGKCRIGRSSFDVWMRPQRARAKNGVQGSNKGDKDAC